MVFQKYSPALVYTGVFFLLSVFLFPDRAHPFGKKRKTVEQPTETQAYPARYIAIGKLYDANFTLPDGKTKVDSSVALPQILITEMSNSKKFRPIAPIMNCVGLALDAVAFTSSESSSCKSSGNFTDVASTRYVFRGGITSFEANIFSLGIKFGWKPGQDINSGNLKGGEGKVTLNVSELGMDFFIEDTAHIQRPVVIAKNASARELGLTLDVDIDFGSIETGVDFVWNSPVTPIFRSLIRKVINKMIQDPRTNFFLDWEANVIGVDLELKHLIFNAGLWDEVAAKNIFTVYDGLKRIGEIKVLNADHNNSSASFKDDSSDHLLKSVRQGDAVRLYFKETPSR